MIPLIAEDNVWTLWALIVAGTALSIWLESRYRWAARISAPVIALLLAMTLSNAGVMPAKEIPAYDFIGTWLVPLALPLLLMRADLVKIARETGRLFLAVHFSALGTVAGGFIAVWALRGGQGIPEIEKAAGIMTGSYVGGMVNFLAIQQTTAATPALTTGLIVADNLVMAGFFLILLSIAGNRFFLKHFPHPHGRDDGTSAGAEEEEPAALTVDGLGAALAFAFGTVALAMALGKGLASLFPGDAKAGSWLHFGQTLLTNKFVLITTLSLVAATLFPRWLERLRGYERIGFFLLFLFLFSIGLPADVRTVIFDTPKLFILCLIMAVMNLIFTLLLGKLFRLDLEDLLLSVNATIGGPPTAAAMAVSRGWSPLVLPALLAGLWGYVIGTPLGLMVYVALAR